MSRKAFLYTLPLLLLTLAASAPSGAASIPQPYVLEGKELELACRLLDDPKTTGKMDGLLYSLATKCGRSEFLGAVASDSPAGDKRPTTKGSSDVAVSDPSGDTGSSTTQSETSLAYNPVTGTVCASFNDSYHGVTQGTGFTGFSRSTDGGATFTDQGAVGAGSGGDPSLVWREADGNFYNAVLQSGGLAVYRSDDDCQTFTFLSQVVTGGDDKEIMAVDNSGGAHDGTLYIAWTDFNAGSQIYETHSTDGGVTWSPQQALSAPGVDVQGAWPTVAPNGDVFIGWLAWIGSGFPDGDVEIQISRSTDGGATFSPLTPPVTGQDNPRDGVATANCGRPALNGNIRYLPSPQLAVGTDGALHVVYSYDPDGFGAGDVVDVFYRRSTDKGATWDPEVRINDDATTNDQYFPTLSVSPTNIVSVAWYDRRLDGSNFLQDYYHRFSFDGGSTFEPSVRLSDVSTPIYLDPSLAACYHGDYDQNIQTEIAALMQWSDDRNIFDGHNDPDTFLDQQPVSTDFLLIAKPTPLEVCSLGDGVDGMYSINVLQFQGFTEPVTLSAAEVTEHSGLSFSFSDNPVTPPSSSTLTVSNIPAVNATFDITVTGTSAPSAIVHDTDVVLKVFNGIPATPTLSLPANGSINQSTTPDFEWSDSTGTYTIEVAEDVDFTTIVESASGLVESEYTLSTELDTITTYYWRVSASNACGESGPSEVFSFTTLAAPGDCAPPSMPNEIFFDDLEGPTDAWTTSSGVGPNTWVLQGVQVQSGAMAWFAEDVAVVSDQYLVSPEVVLPPDDLLLTMQFYNRQELEDRAGGCFDGGVVEITTDAGGNWIRLESELLTDPYDGPISNGFSNPLADQNAWCGDPQEWLKSVVDIDAFAGETVQFRFRLATDSSVSHPGWWIDDFKIQSCGGGSAIFVDGFESGDTSSWSSTVGN